MDWGVALATPRCQYIVYCHNYSLRTAKGKIETKYDDLFANKLRVSVVDPLFHYEHVSACNILCHESASSGVRF